MSFAIKLTEPSNKISVEAAVLIWIGIAVLIIYSAKSIQTVTTINIIEGMKNLKTILSLLFLVHQDFFFFLSLFGLVTSLSKISSLGYCSNVSAH